MPKVFHDINNPLRGLRNHGRNKPAKGE